MNLKVENTTDVSEIIKLDDEYSNHICVLPDNIHCKTQNEEYFYAFSLPTIQKVLKERNLELHQFNELKSANLIDQRGLEYFAPIILVGSLYYSQNPDAISIALGLISNYLSKLFSVNNKAKANFTIYARDDKNKKTKRIHYDGPVSGIKELEKVVKDTFKEFGD